MKDNYISQLYYNFQIIGFLLSEGGI